MSTQPLTPAELAAIEKAAAEAAGEGLTPAELAAATAMADKQNRYELAAGYGAAGTSWEQLHEWYPSMPVPATQPGAGDAETSGAGSGRGTGGTEAQNSAQAVEEWGVQINGGSVVPIQGPDARETAEEFRVAYVKQSRYMGRAASAVAVRRVIGPWMPVDDGRGRADER